MRQKVLKTGNSLAVSIPSEFARTFGILPGMSIDLKTDFSRQTLTYTFSGTGQLHLLAQSK